MISSIPPVGHPVRFTNKQAQPSLLFPGYRLEWVNSGTQALAYSLLCVKQLCKEVGSPEVIVPGYCCPDLLSAALFAGFKPVVVDVNPNDPTFNQELLAAAWNKNTCAIIAINFMGLKERLSELKSMAEANGAYLIEDNAQWFPEPGEVTGLEGHFVTFSFGRGKAISLLGGGLVAVKDSLPSVALPQLDVAGVSNFTLKSKVFDFLTTPIIYGCLEKLPALKLGATEFHRLEGLEQLPVQKQALFTSNYQAYQARSRHVESVLDDLFSELNELKPVLTSGRRGRLLRYPVLLKSKELRGKLYRSLVQQGVGISDMYKTDLSNVSGVAPLGITMPELPAAASFAQRFLTFPVHSRVSPEHLKRIEQAIKKLQ